jgi:hypothetical protein
MNRYLMEDKYIPKKLNDILTPNFEIIKKIQEHIDKDNMNLLFIGSIYTFKIQVMKLAIQEYYLKKGYKNTDIDPLKIEYVLVIDCFTDITFSGSINELKTFCKSNSKMKKCVFIDNFDIINEYNQQYFKKLMEQYPNVFFLFGCENTSKIHEIIQTRLTPIYFEDLTKNEYKSLIDKIKENEGISIDNSDRLLECSYLSVYYK